MAYITYPEQILWRSRIDGSDRLQLTRAPFRAFGVAWSLDGKRILFDGFEPAKNSGIYEISVEGGAPRQVAYDPGSDLFYGNWAADGREIIFQKVRANKSNENYTDIEVLDIQNGQVSILPGSEKLIVPTISPDGRWLAATPSNRQKLMLFDFATRKWTELAKTDVGGITWNRDGKYLYFDSGSGLDPAISRLRMADRKLERVTGLKDFRRVIFGFFPWSGLTPDGDPLLLRDVGNQEVYALDLEAP